MPSPIAHGALLLVAWPRLRRGLDPGIAPARRRAACGLLAIALMAPDLDLLVGLVTGEGLTHYHNGPSHSLLVTPLFAVAFAVSCRAVAGGSWRSLLAIGALASASHPLMDALTRGPGVQLLWPITGARLPLPFYVFYGVRHSQWTEVHLHLLTLVNEGLFVAGLAWLARRRAPHLRNA